MSRPKRIKPKQTWRVMTEGRALEFTVARVRKDKLGVTRVYGSDAAGTAINFAYEEMRDDYVRFQFMRAQFVCSLHLELAKPLDESWDTIGPLLHLEASATPKLLDAAYDTLVAIELVGKDVVKDVVAPDVKASTPDGIAYQAVGRAVESLRVWHPKGETKRPYAALSLPGGMKSAISRAASQAFQRRDQGRVSFSSKRILVRADEAEVTRDEKGFVLSVALREGVGGRVRFALAGSKGSHRDVLRGIVGGTVAHGSVQIRRDEDRGKWYAHLAYEAQEAAALPIDTARVLAVHRGLRNALYMLPSHNLAGGHAVPGAKLMGQRRKLAARQREIRRIAECELGAGAKGHGRARRVERYSQVEDKIARVTKTFCQVAASAVASRAAHLGCGLVLIEDYGGIEPDKDRALRRVLERGPLFQLKEAIAHACKKAGLALREVPSAYISTTCPACESCDERQHNVRTGVFHCRVCTFERPADWVATFWMLTHGGADMTDAKARLARERAFRQAANKRKGQTDNDYAMKGAAE